MNTDELCRRVPLSPTSQEYQDVANNVKATGGGIFQQILMVRKITCNLWLTENFCGYLAAVIRMFLHCKDKFNKVVISNGYF